MSDARGPGGRSNLYSISIRDRPPSFVCSGAKLGGTPSGVSDG